MKRTDVVVAASKREQRSNSRHTVFQRQQAAPERRFSAIYRRLWNLTLSGGIVLSSNVSLAVMHPYLCVHSRVRRLQATNSAIYDVSSKVYRDFIALDVSLHDMTLCLTQRRIPTPRTNLRHRTPRFSKPVMFAACNVLRFPLSDPVALALMRPLIIHFIFLY